MNKKGMIGQVIGAIIIITITAALFFNVTEVIDNTKLQCMNGSVNDRYNCDWMNDENTRTLMDLIPFIFILGTLIIVVPVILRMFRGIFGGIGEFFESFETTSSNDDDEKEKHLKRMKSKLKNELNRKPFESNQKPKTTPKTKGVQWGSGVEQGEGMDFFEDKQKGGDK